MKTAGKIPWLFLEQLRLGELPPARRAELVQRAGGEAALARELKLLEAERDSLLAAHPASELAREVAGRLAARRAQALPRRQLVLALSAGACLAALAVALLPRGAAERLKGGALQLTAHRLRGTHSEKLAPGESLRAGDIVQLSYQAAGYPFGAVVSIDGAGGVTLHFPADGATLAKLKSNGEAALPGAVQLDAAPRFERFFLAVARTPLPLAQVTGAARALAATPHAAEQPLPLPAGFEQQSLLFAKATEVQP